MRELILVVDDNLGFREMLVSFLEFEGYEARDVDGVAAVELTRRWLPAAVLLDVLMPGTSGLEIATELRADPTTAPIPIILMTSMPEAVSSDPAAVFDQVLIKPFELDDLLRALQRVTNQTSVS